MSASVLPCSSWRAGWQPVANEAETTRVAEGNIERCAAKPCARAREARERGRRLLADQVAAQAIEHDHDGSAH